MVKKKLSLTFRFLRKIGFNYSEEEYGDINMWQVFRKFFGNIRLKFLEGMLDWSILEPIEPRMLRPFILRRMGCNVGKKCFIGDYVRVDTSHTNMIYIEDSVSIASGSRLLCHQRNFSDYCVGDDYMKLGYIIKPIHLKKGCLIGMESFIMPGVTIGEGAIIGAGSLVTTDIPAWTIAIGRPARVIKQIPKRVIEE